MFGSRTRKNNPATRTFVLFVGHIVPPVSYVLASGIPYAGRALRGRPWTKRSPDPKATGIIVQ